MRHVRAARPAPPQPLADGVCGRCSGVDLKGKDAVPETVDHAVIWVRNVTAGPARSAALTARP
jgi:hypothetical protein